MTASVLFTPDRGYRVRITGNGIDTKRNVPRELFGTVPYDRKSKRGDRIARKYADSLKEVVPSERREASYRYKPAHDGIGATQQDREVVPIGSEEADYRQGRAVETRPCVTGGSALRTALESDSANRSHGYRAETVAGAQRGASMDFAQIGSLFLQRNRGHLDPKTITRYGQIVANLVEFFGTERPDQIHVGRLEQYRDKRLADHWTPRLGTVPCRSISPRTVWGELQFAVQLLGFGFDRAIETGMGSLPVRRAPDVADRCRTRGRVLSFEEVMRAYEAAGSLQRAADRYQRLIVTALTTMLRMEPLLNLDWGWIDLPARTVTIPAQYVKKGRGRVRQELTLPIGEWAVEALSFSAYKTSTESRPAENGPVALFLGANLQETNGPTSLQTGCVWGAPIANVQPTLLRIARIAGIRPFSLHDLRRSGATILINHRCAKHPSGIDKFVVDRLLNHAMPMNDAAYYRIDMDVLRDAVSVFGELWDAYRGVDGERVVAMGRKA